MVAHIANIFLLQHKLYRKKTQSPIEMNTTSCDNITANQAYDVLSHKFYDDIDDISVVYEEISTA